MLKLTTNKYGFWELINSKGSHIKALCKCICGNLKEVNKYNLQKGKSTNCGCVQIKKLILSRFKHGETKTRLYQCWQNMKSRCENFKNEKYKNYGGRKITICGEWYDYKKFSNWAKNNGYRNYLTIERIDVNGNYEPSNCTFIPMSEQYFNRTDNNKVTYQGKTQTITEWANHLKQQRRKLIDRVKRYGIDRAFSLPKNFDGRRRECKVL